MALFGNAVDKIAAELRKLQSTRRDLAIRVIAAQAEIAEFRGTSGDEILTAFLDPENRGAQRVKGRAHIAEIEHEVYDLTAAEVACVRKIRKAIIDLAMARAAVVRGEAAKLQRELEKHNAETTRLLALAEAHEGGGVKYREFLPESDSITTKDGHTASFGPRELPVTKSWQMSERIRQLILEAEGIERQGEQSAGAGMVSGQDLTALLAVTVDAERLAPTEAAITAWLADADVRAAANWDRECALIPRFDAGGRPIGEPGRDIEYTLFWDDRGRVEEQRSTATNRLRFTPAPWPLVTTI